MRLALIATIGAILVMAVSATACAGLVGSYTRAIPSSDGRYLLVLIAPDDERADAPGNGPYIGVDWTAEEVREAQEEFAEMLRLEATYPQSGLYRNDGSTQMLWPIECFSGAKSIYVSNDGVHLVVAYLNWDGGASDRGNAFEFFASGVQLASYNEHDLLTGYQARILAAYAKGAEYPTVTDASFDDRGRTFSVTTNWGDVLRFDITTGQLVTSQQPAQRVAISIVIVTVTAGVAGLLWRRIRDEQRIAGE